MKIASTLLIIVILASCGSDQSEEINDKSNNENADLIDCILTDVERRLGSKMNSISTIGI